MKHFMILSVLFITILHFSCNRGPKIVFDEKVHDFGEVKQNTELKHIFTFKNTGKSELIIQEIKPGCSCTGVLLSEKNIPTDGIGDIQTTLKVGYYEGLVNKSITVFSNDKDNDRVILKLVAFVERE